MNFLNPVLTAIGAVVVAGGGGALIAFLMIKAFAKGWLDSFFQAKAARLKTEQDIVLAELKRAHDAALKDVQAVIDKDLHRARKLYDREFEVLGEGWTLLVKAFDTTHSTLVTWVTRIDMMDEKQRNRAFEAEKFEHWQIDQVLALEGQEMVDKFTKIKDQKRLITYREHRLEFARFLAVNAVFMPDGFKERFAAIDALIGAALVEFELRIDYPAQYAAGSALMKLAQEGKPLLDELEALIHARIWSAGAERDKCPS